MLNALPSTRLTDSAVKPKLASGVQTPGMHTCYLLDRRGSKKALEKSLTRTFPAHCVHARKARGCAFPQVTYETRDSSTLLDDPSASSSGVIRTESSSSALLLMSPRAT
jgi:hypothetical protein